MATNTRQYHYTSLASTRHIRLAKFSTNSLDDGDDQLTCELTAYALDTAPAYCTLSYTWGPEQPSSMILMDDGCTCLTIRENLALWLRKHGVHYSAQGNLFWVDMLCIDQSNIEERAAQVRIMRDIYRKAEMLCVWLGEESEDSNDAIETLMKAGSFFQHLY